MNQKDLWNNLEYLQPKIKEDRTMSKQEFEEKFDEMMQELELLPGESIDICYMLVGHQEIGCRCEVWQNG